MLRDLFPSEIMSQGCPDLFYQGCNIYISLPCIYVNKGKSSTLHLIHIEKKQQWPSNRKTLGYMYETQKALKSGKIIK